MEGSLEIWIFFALFFLMYARKGKWNTPTFKKVLGFGTGAAGIIGFMLSDTNEERMAFYSIMNVAIYVGADSLFKYLSLKKHNRDFNLWLNFSYDHDGIFVPWSHPKFKPSDKLFSFILLVLIAGLFFLGAVLFGHDDLYGRLMH